MVGRVHLQEWSQESGRPRVRIMALGVIIDLERRCDSREGEGLVLNERPPPVREAERIVVAEVDLGITPNHGIILELGPSERHALLNPCMKTVMFAYLPCPEPPSTRPPPTSSFWRSSPPGSGLAAGPVTRCGCQRAAPASWSGSRRPPPGRCRRDRPNRPRRCRRACRVAPRRTAACSCLMSLGECRD